MKFSIMLDLFFGILYSPIKLEEVWTIRDFYLKPKTNQLDDHIYT